MCEFHDCNGNGLGDIWWTDKLIYFSSVDNATNDKVLRGGTEKKLMKRIK